MEPTIRLNHNVVAVESNHLVHAMVEVAAPPAPVHDRPPVLKLVLVIDRSGSMAGDKLEVESHGMSESLLATVEEGFLAGPRETFAVQPRTYGAEVFDFDDDLLALRIRCS